jgi:DMSO/TMAO reductase YedYZ molybdopterin-dependent catalytic subunit
MTANEQVDAAELIDRVRALLVRADEVAKAAPGASQPATVRERARALLDDARDVLDRARGTGDAEVVTALGVQVSRRMLDLDGADLVATTRPTAGMRRAPTSVDDPSRQPPGQHLTAGFPVLHVGAAPSEAAARGWTVTVTGRVHERLRLPVDDLHAEAVTSTSDFHCVTTWSRLDNAWTGVPVADLLARARPRPEATHAVVAGWPAYSANLSLADLAAPGVLLAWAVDGADLSIPHGGPLRLVVPHLYGWKSVKWVTELRLTDRDVPGYWEERGYHMRGDPWQEQRFRGD